MHVSYRRPVELFVGSGPVESAIDSVHTGRCFVDLPSTSMPASESDPTSVFAIRIGPHFSLSEQVGGVTTWEYFGSTFGSSLGEGGEKFQSSSILKFYKNIKVPQIRHPRGIRG